MDRCAAAARYAVVNVGDLLARWSNDRFRSTQHRVINKSGRERFSIASFYDPTYGAVVDPRDLRLDGAKPLYAPVSAGDYILGRINDSIAYRRPAQRHHVAPGSPPPRATDGGQ